MGLFLGLRWLIEAAADFARPQAWLHAHPPAPEMELRAADGTALGAADGAAQKSKLLSSESVGMAGLGFASTRDYGSSDSDDSGLSSESEAEDDLVLSSESDSDDEGSSSSGSDSDSESSSTAPPVAKKPKLAKPQAPSSSDSDSDSDSSSSAAVSAAKVKAKAAKPKPQAPSSDSDSDSSSSSSSTSAAPAAKPKKAPKPAAAAAARKPVGAAVAAAGPPGSGPRAIAASTSLRVEQVHAVLRLLDEGATVPFITRYRQAVTGGLDEDAVRAVRDAAEAQRDLAKAKRKALQVVAERAPAELQAQLRAAIESAADKESLKEILAPFGGAGKRSLAEAARVDGLEPIALKIWGGRVDDAELQRLVGAVRGKGPRKSASEVLEGVRYILAELAVTSASESRGPVASLRQRWGDRVWQSAELHTAASRKAAAQAKPKSTSAKAGKKKAASSDARVVEERLAAGTYSKFIAGGAGWSSRLRHMAPHVTLAVNRGETEKVLTVGCQLPPYIAQEIERELIGAASGRVRGSQAPTGTVLRCLQDAARDGCGRLLLPTLYRAARRRLTEVAAAAAAASFGKSLRGLLLAPPYKVPILGLDPGFRNGCKFAVVDTDGALLESGVICNSSTVLGFSIENEI